MKKTSNKLSFGQRMKLLKAQKAKAEADRRLLENFPSQPSLEANIQHHLVFPIGATEPVLRTVIVNSETPLERAVRCLRERAQGQES